MNNLTNRKFGYLIALKDVGSKNNTRIWLCKCKCNNFIEVPSTCLVSGNTKSCGCYFKEISVKSKLGKNNPMWKGNKVGLVALHQWVSKRLSKPKLCQCCNQETPYDLANKGIYNRDLKNWEWLCRSCHMKKDGRTKELLKNAIRSNTGRKQTKEHIKKRMENRLKSILLYSN